MSGDPPSGNKRVELASGFDALPCPFCGIPPAISFRSHAEYPWHSVEVKCLPCGVTMREDAETWNEKRSRVSIVKKAMAALRDRWNRREGTR